MISGQAKIAVITGAGKGIGRALVKKFINEGYSVVGFVRTNSQRDELEKDFSFKVTPVVCDLLSEESIIEAEKFIKGFSQIDVLINNAGVAGSGSSINKLDFSHLNKVLNTNCLGAMRVTEICIPLLLKSESPRVINISSRFGSLSKVSSGELSSNTSYSYRISKAALNMFTACLSQEFSKTKMKIVSIHPGLVNTGLINHVDGIRPDESAEKLYAVISDYDSLKSGTFLDNNSNEIYW